MPDWFRTPHATLTRAKQHIADFIGERNRFIQDETWTHATEINRSRDCKEYKIRFFGLDNLSAIASDAVVNLRSVLDQVGAASRASGNLTGKKTSFPFGDTPQAVENAIKGWSKDVPANILDIMRSFKPYRTGNADPLLWSLNQLANLNKHGLIRPTTIFLKYLVLGGPEDMFRPLMQSPPSWDSGNHEIVYAIAGLDIEGLDSIPKPHANVHIQIDVTFSEVKTMADCPAVEILNDMACVVESVLVAIEAETRRLFPASF